MDIAFKNNQKKSNNKFLLMITDFFKNHKSQFEYFLFLLIMGILFFFSILITNNFTTPYSGDYCAQQFSFYLNGYDDWHHFFKTGEFVFYDTNTYLGANNIGSNSFYYLFDPFFLLTLIFPRAIIPQVMAAMTILKLACSGLAFYFYIRYFKVKEETSMLCGLAYAFSGWVSWYLWFNHFSEVAVFFPLILLGVEKILKEKRPFVLMVSLLLMGVTNYFFFICFVICAFIYAMFRYFQRLKLNNAKDNLIILGIGFIGFLVGILLSLVVVLPGAMIAINSDRATSSTYLANLLSAFKEGKIVDALKLLFSFNDVDGGNKGYRVLYPIIEFFFPTTSDRGTPLTVLGNESYDNVAGSLFCFSPFIVLLVPTIIDSFKRRKISHFIAIIFFILAIFTPFFYYLCFGFTKPYSRWYLFVATSLITYVGLYIDRIKEMKPLHLLFGYLFAFIGGVASVLIAYYLVNNEKYNFSERMPLFIPLIIYLVYVTVFYFVVRIALKKGSYYKAFNIFVCIELVTMGSLITIFHGYTNYNSVNNGLEKNEDLYALTSRIKKDDPTYYRCYSSLATDSARNDGMRNNYNGVSFFHSIYNFNTVEFITWSRLTQNINGWSGSYVEKRANLDTFLGIKYYFVEKDTCLDDVNINVPFYFEDISSLYPNDSFYVYRNTKFIDLGFSFDKIATYNSMEDKQTTLASSSYYPLRNEELYLKCGLYSYEYYDRLLELSNNTLTEQTIYNFGNEQALNKNISLQFDYYSTGSSNPLKMSLDELKNIPANYSLTNPTASNSSTNHIVIFLSNSGFSYFPFDEEGNIFTLQYSFTSNKKINVYFLDENDNICLFDNHNDDNTTSSNKSLRTFYTKNKIKNIIIVPRFSEINAQSSIRLYYESGTDFYNTLSTLEENKLNNVNYSTNHFDFDTNYSSKRVIVTRIAYEEGWKVKEIDENGEKKNIEVFPAQGGFVSFLANEGNNHYELDFYPPYLKEGNALSFVGMVSFIIMYLTYSYFDIKKVDKENKKLFFID
ncbi:MAG: YfhO family protein [Bacilli bacterium]